MRPASVCRGPLGVVPFGRHLARGRSSGGFGGDQLQISPPFIISEAEIDELVGALDEVLGEVARWLPGQPRLATRRSISPGTP